MKLADFAIGSEFWLGDRKWRCTDIGTRVVVAIRVDTVRVSQENDRVITMEDLPQIEAQAKGWFDGPPYAIAEEVFDEDDIEACSPVPLEQ
jgi:hypothetical protein